MFYWGAIGGPIVHLRPFSPWRDPRDLRRRHHDLRAASASGFNRRTPRCRRRRPPSHAPDAPLLDPAGRTPRAPMVQLASCPDVPSWSSSPRVPRNASYDALPSSRQNLRNVSSVASVPMSSISSSIAGSAQTDTSFLFRSLPRPPPIRTAAAASEPEEELREDEQPERLPER